MATRQSLRQAQRRTNMPKDYKSENKLLKAHIKALEYAIESLFTCLSIVDRSGVRRWFKMDGKVLKALQELDKVKEGD